MKSRNFVWYWNVLHYSVYRFLKNQSFTNPTIHAGSFMGILVMNIDWALFNVCQLFFHESLSDWSFKNQTNGALFLGTIILPAFLFNYFLLFKNSKYVAYFAEFDDFNSDKKQRYFWVSIVSILLIWMFFLLSFKFTR
ncbi:hypothetical protein [uncultured Mucilaginibacter sp.]|uniref:hypothetical protein n=1 Tax=uncultured Mucilaginibacter sp. TaxID=797541 RepID=UPI0025D46A43|nr:hypothetical protein [uncultured Mucilaginibacter sp.]